MIKVAIITPIPLLSNFASMSDNYHLLLSNLFHREGYAEYYRGRRVAGDFLILDNSAHELGHGESFDALEKKIELVHPNEVVVPDRLFFGDDTVENAQEFIPQFRRRFGDEIGLVGVPQGRTQNEWGECLIRLLELGVNTIGISKDYEVWNGGLIGLAEKVDTAARMARVSEPVPIHMLGWGRDLAQLREYSQFNREANCSFIRGVDSAKPLVYADAGIDLSQFPPDDMPRYPKRPGDFFSVTGIDVNLAMSNIALMKNWANL